ncbi:hypothetical protein WJX73_000646 [Symbiochloris irregularis]|uniref:MYND-type domain-containing protein n=1 Tax=Symbiochloris irregularis TaxID=706552 RepID=A0AAW1NRW6_9CHLO
MPRKTDGRALTETQQLQSYQGLGNALDPSQLERWHADRQYPSSTPFRFNNAAYLVALQMAGVCEFADSRSAAEVGQYRPVGAFRQYRLLMAQVANSYFSSIALWGAHPFTLVHEESQTNILCIVNRLRELAPGLPLMELQFLCFLSHTHMQEVSPAVQHWFSRANEVPPIHRVKSKLELMILKEILLANAAKLSSNCQEVRFCSKRCRKSHLHLHKESCSLNSSTASMATSGGPARAAVPGPEAAPISSHLLCLEKPWLKARLRPSRISPDLSPLQTQIGHWSK